MPGWPVLSFDRVPALTADQMREVDRVMIEDLGIQLLQMMENAGRSLAELVVSLHRPDSAVVLAGPGGNGGGGLVAARHLANRGIATRVVLARSDLAEVPSHQLAILRKINVPIDVGSETAAVIVDALIGYSLQGDPRGVTAELIEWANAAGSPILSLDTPSGLDVTTGLAGTPCITADATLTLALPKLGLRKAPEVGRLFLADISVPPAVYAAFGMDAAAVFAESAIIEVLR